MLKVYLFYFYNSSLGEFLYQISWQSIQELSRLFTQNQKCINEGITKVRRIQPQTTLPNFMAVHPKVVEIFSLDQCGRPTDIAIHRTLMLAWLKTSPELYYSLKLIINIF